MNPQFCRTASDRNSARNEYIKNLQLETSNNLMNYNANQVFKQTGVLPPSITALLDTRSITEKYADTQKARVAVLSGLREITDGANANQIVSQIQSKDMITLLNNLPQIISEIKPKWSLGITAPAFMGYWDNYKKAVAMNSGVSVYPIIQSNQLLTNIQGILQNIQATLPTQQDYKLMKSVFKLLPQTEQVRLTDQMIEDAMEQADEIVKIANEVSQMTQEDPIRLENIAKQIQIAIENAPPKSVIQSLTQQANISVSLGNSPKEANDLATQANSQLSVGNPSNYQNIEQEFESMNSPSSQSPTTTVATESTREQIGRRVYFQGTPETYEQWENMKWDNKLSFVKTIFKNSDPKINWGSIPKPHSIKHLAQSKYNPGNTNSTTRGTRSNHWIGDTNIEELMEDYFKVNKQGGAQESKKSSGKKPKPVYIEEESEEEGAEPTAEDIRKATTGSGVRKVGRPRIMGRGVATAVAVYTKRPKVDTSHKVERVPSYIEFGKHLLHQHNLLGGILQIRRRSGNIINELPRQSIGGKLKKILITLTGTGSPSFEDINELSTHEKELLNKVVKHCKIDQRLLVPTPNKTKEEQDMNRLQILSGEITAGNNNPTIVKELKTLLLRLKNSGRIPKREAHEIMEDLLTLGY